MKKKKLIYVVLFLACLSFTVQARKWLPGSENLPVGIRLLQCSYQEARLTECKPILGGTDDWEVTSESVPAETGETTVFTFVAKRSMKDVGVAVAFDRYNWNSDNYVMIPASVYNGNRQRIVNRSYATGLDATDYGRKDLALTSNPIPQLSPEFGAPSLLEVSVCNAATPAIAFLERQKKQATLLFTDQGFEWKGKMIDHALIVEESPDRSMASFVISTPGVREKKPEFIGFSSSPDRGIQVEAGDEITIRVTNVSFHCEDTPALLKRFHYERKKHTASLPPRDLMPMSEVFRRMVNNIEERYYQGEEGEYYCPENADWMSYGWIGGLMNTYPMLALGDAEHLKRVKNTFAFAVPGGQGKSGYYYDVLGADGKVFSRDAAAQHPGIGLTRKNADLLYWMVKQFMLLEVQGKSGEISSEWKRSVRRLADAFADTWKKRGTWGNYLEVETGDVAVYNTTGGAMAVAGLTLASTYFDHAEYLEIARKAADAYYESFTLLGFTSGGCGDILQNADSETAIALATSLMTLYETTGEEAYLKRSSDVADLCATWTVSFPYRLPDDTPLARLGANLTGAVWASTQNKHGAPGFCTQSGDVLFKLYRATGDTLYAHLLRDVIHAHAEGIQPNGKITERLTYCDADSRGSRGDGGKTGWNETNGALMALEIPGIYLQTDANRLFVFDHVDVKIQKRNNKELVLKITNPTTYDATVTIFVENAKEALVPLGDNAFRKWQQDTVGIKAGKTKMYKIDIR